MYSEVNADLVSRRLEGRANYQWRRAQVQTGNIGRKICTKMIAIIDGKSRFGANVAEDILYQLEALERQGLPT